MAIAVAMRIKQHMKQAHGTFSFVRRFAAGSGRATASSAENPPKQVGRKDMDARFFCSGSEQDGQKSERKKADHPRCCTVFGSFKAWKKQDFPGK